MFSKYASVVAILDRTVASVSAGIIECFQKMMKKPEILYTDGETSFNDTSMIEYYKKKYQTLYQQKPRSLCGTIHQNIKGYDI